MFLSRILFGTLSTLLFPVIMLYALTSRKLRENIEERLLGGSWREIDLPESIWIHAASVGELQGVVPLLEKLRAETNVPIIITTTSMTGRAKARAMLGSYNALLLPYDHPLLIASAIRKIKPKLFILFETELWPNLLLQLEKFKVSVVLINGRISDKTFPAYLRLKFLIKPLLATFDRCLVQSSKDQIRYEELGALDVLIGGNTKYDNPISGDVIERAQVLKQFGCEQNVDLLVCGSVRPGESEIIFSAFKELREQFPNLCLLIAPRHPEQFEAEAENALRFGFSVSRRTAPKPESEVLLMDSIGELKSAYAASTISFVGGTLVPIGGHNPLEPALFSKPIMFGPYTQNVEEIAEELVDSGGAIRVKNVSEFRNQIEKFLLDQSYLAETGKKAFSVLNGHSGAVGRVLKELQPWLNNASPSFMQSGGILDAILKPIEIVYLLITSLRNYCYDKGLFKSYKSCLPVICCGNLTVGGNAKSPVTQEIVKLLLARKLKPVILLRGYSGSETGPAQVTDSSEVSKFGDEACMHKFELEGIPVVVSRSRVLGAKYIESNSLGDVIVLDDGFQHRALKRDLNLLLFDSVAVDQATKGRLLPLGRLRESLVPALKRADAICLIERGITVNVPSWKPERLPAFNLALEFSELRFLDSNRTLSWSELTGKKVSLISSIAKPDGFKAMVQGQGAIIQKTIFKPDHAYWSSDDVAEINSLPGDFIITTAKDRIKLKNLKFLPERIIVAEIKIDSSDEFKNWIFSKLESRLRVVRGKESLSF